MCHLKRQIRMCVYKCITKSNAENKEKSKVSHLKMTHGVTDPGQTLAYDYHNQ